MIRIALFVCVSVLRHLPSPAFPLPPWVRIGSVPLRAAFRRPATRHLVPHHADRARGHPRSGRHGTRHRVKDSAALETCLPAALPPWQETRRIVMRYGNLLQIDVAPALSRLQQHLPATAAARASATSAWSSSNPARPADAGTGQPVTQPHQSRSATAAARPAPKAGQADDLDETPPATAARLVSRALSDMARDEASASGSRKSSWARLPRLPSRRTAIGIGLPIGLMAAMAVSLVTVPTALQASLSVLPSGIGQSLKQRLERVSHRTITGPDGLKWIVVVDPRSRKADRLPIASKQ